MAQIFSIDDNNNVVISNIALSNSAGNVTHTGNFDINGDASVQNLIVNGELTVDTLNVKNIVDDTRSNSGGFWNTITEAELTGKGLRWVWGDGDTQLSYRTGNRIWTNANLDLGPESSYRIDNISVLTSNSLGPTISKSNLRQVGTLTSLSVSGDVNISEFAFFNSNSNRLGLGTEDPSASITILENNVEMSFGSPAINLGTVGTASNHDFSIISDNIPRVTVKNNGEIHISDEASKAGVLRVFGTLYADAIVSDTRIERTTPLEFKATRDSSIFGKGLIWSGTGNTRQLIMLPGPDRIWTSESIDIGQDQAYYINGTAVLNEISIGKSVLYSNLIRVGHLESLDVNGDTTLLGELTVKSGIIRSEQIILNDGVSKLTATNTGIDSSKSIKLSVNGLESFYADDQEISIGNKQSNRRPVKIFGQLSVGINNPDPSISLSVSGNISFANKKFITGLNAPTEGMFSKGDICWNQQPQEDGYVGWVCISEGAPGMWAPFGAIGRNA